MLDAEVPQPPAHRLASPTARTPSPLAALVARFLMTCGTEATRRTYCGVLREFGGSFDGVRGDDGEGARLHLAAELYAVCLRQRLEARTEREATVKRKMSALSSFLAFCVQEGLLARNPLERLKRPSVRPDTSAERALSRTERDSLLAQATREREALRAAPRATQLRARKLELAIQLCLTCGCRIGELLRLRGGDIEGIDAEKARAVFHAKGAERHAPLIPRALADTLLALAFEANGDQAKEVSIFAGRAKPKSVEEGLNTALRELARRAGIEKRVTVHTLRATCATLHHDAGVPIVRIQRLLGHRSISTTSLYIRSADEGLLEANLPQDSHANI